MSKKSNAPTNRIKKLTGGEMALLTQSLLLPDMEDNVPEEVQDRINSLRERPLSAGDTGDLFMELNERYMSYITTLMEQVGFMDYVMQKEFQDKYGKEDFKQKIEDYRTSYTDLMDKESEKLNKKRQEMVDTQYEKITELVEGDGLGG